MKDEFISVIRDYASKISPETKVYIGADSRRKRKGGPGQYVIMYTTSIVFHLDGKKGCKVFADLEPERDYHGNLQLRLMGEVYRAAELYQKVKDALPDHDIQVHLDINPKKEHRSSTVMNEAVGYIRGVCGVDPVLKPSAWAASTCSDLWELKYA